MDALDLKGLHYNEIRAWYGLLYNLGAPLGIRNVPPWGNAL